MSTSTQDFYLVEYGNSVVVLAVQDAQNRQEQIQHVKIQRDRRRDLFLDMVVAHDELRVDEDIAREDQRRDDPVHQLHRAVNREERGHEPEQDEHPQPAEQVGDPAREVVARLAREDGQRDEDAQREDERLDDDAGVVERGHHADAVGLHGREGR